jgi:predicted nucleic acid-binding protein
MERLHVLLDSCVLFPMYLRDTLLCAAEAGLYSPCWSQEILNGITRNLVNTGKISAEKAIKLEATIKKAFPEAMVEVIPGLADMMTNHPGDRHVLAAGVTAKVDIIVTSNLKHFQAKDVAPWNIRVLSADEFLTTLYSIYPEEMVEVVLRQSQTLKRPPMTVSELLDLLSKKDGANAGNFANYVRLNYYSRGEELT